MLIDRSIRFDLGGEAAIEHAADGLRATLRIPAGFITAAGEPTAEPTRGRTAQPEAVAASDLRGKQILLVEDQLLIAMDLEESWRAGCGRHRYRRVGDRGAAAAETVSPDLAILDVNLGSETSALIADELVRRGIPFAFATGYSDRLLIPERFATAPVIRKPFDAPMVIGQVAELLRGTATEDQPRR